MEDSLQDKQQKINETEQKSKKPVKKKLSIQEQNDIVQRTTQAVNLMAEYKKSACYYDPIRPNIDERNKRDDELLLMFKEENESGWSNVTSSALYRNVQAIMGEFSDSSIKDKAIPTRARDEYKAKIAERILEDWSKRTGIKRVDERTFSEYLRYGVAIEEISWKKVMRKVKKIKNVKELTPDEEENLTQLKEIPYSWENHVSFNDVIRTNVLPESFFIEYGASDLFDTGYNKPANECAVIDWINIEDAIRFMKSDPATIKENAAKIKRAGANNTAKGFQSIPNAEHDTGGINQVKRTRYFNVENDEVVTLFNDILVKVAPLPFHRLPFINYKFIEYKDNFYVPGLGAYLDPIVREQEDIKNALLDKLKISLNPPTYVDDLVYPDVAKGVERFEPGELIRVENLSNTPNAFREHPVPNNNDPAAYNMLQALDEDVVEISGINKKRLGSMQNVGTATEMSVMDSASAKLIRMLFSNFFKSRVHATGMVWRFIRQEYPKETVMETVGDKKVAKPRAILLHGIEIKIPKTDNEKYRERRIEGYSEFEIKKDFVDTDELLFDTNPEFVAKLTAQQEVMKIQNALPQLMPFAGDPSYVQQGQPMPIIDIRKLVGKYVSKAELGDDLLVYEDKDEDIERSEAMDQNARIFAGENIVGKKGRCRSHIEAHEEALTAILDHLEKLDESTQPDPAAESLAEELGMPSMRDEETKQVTQAAIAQMGKRVKYLIKHLQLDKMNVNAEIDYMAELDRILGNEQPMQPQMPQMPMPQDMAMGGQGGEVPMPSNNLSAPMMDSGVPMPQTMPGL